MEKKFVIQLFGENRDSKEFKEKVLQKFETAAWTIVKKVDTNLGKFFKVSRFKIIR